MKRFLLLCTCVFGAACGGEAPDLLDASELGGASSGLATDATVPGAATAPYPTLSNLSVEWAFTGDDNANGVVTVRYRPTGTTAWRDAMPLRRIPAGTNSIVSRSWSSRHSGSIFDLTPATTYEVELTLTDPDGGSTVTMVSATTRAIPAPMPGAPVKTATPATFSNVASGAQPGDIIELTAGTYPGFSWTKSGLAGMPIVIRGQPGVVIEGAVSLRNISHVQLTGVTVNNGRIRFDNSNHIAITRCTVNSHPTDLNGDGIIAPGRAENAYIADNVLNGTTPWAEHAWGNDPDNRGEGIQVNGPGHVIQNNRVTGYRDGISLMESSSADQYSIDILNNDLSGNADDGIEADFCFHNCRIMRNRLTNNFVALSSQPSLGGPTYFIRNAVYNAVYVAFKLNQGSRGDVLLHNTVVKNGDAFGVYAGQPITNLYTRNNLFIGGPGGTYNVQYYSGSGKVMDLDDLVIAGSSLNHDGFGSTTGTFTGHFGSINFSSLSALRSTTTEMYAQQVDLGVFASSVAFPSSPLTLYSPPDLRIRADVPAADAGQVIRNINDVIGVEPALGAYEPGSALPTYGPR